jgi:hypothetical protein
MFHHLKNKINIYVTCKKIIRSGPSMIVYRYQEVGKTLIRGNKLFKILIGFDAIALYLWALMQNMPECK